MSERYDRAVTIFSPDGHLLQVEYAQEAVRKGSTAIGVRTRNAIVLGVEKRHMVSLQEERPLRKICMLDEHIVLTFAGLTADARVLVSRAQVECQSHRLNLERPVSVEYITRFIAQLMQNYTQSNGRRPFGISCLVGGFDENGSAHLFQTEPSGIYYEWTANTTGRGGETVREFLEKHADQPIHDEASAVRFTIRALLSSSQMTKNNMDVAVLYRNQPLRMLDSKFLADQVADIEHENELEARTKQRITF